jgi:formate-dependent nitrite reductase membrane component NrfD
MRGINVQAPARLMPGESSTTLSFPRRWESRIFYLSFLFLLSFNSLAFAEEKISVFPTSPVEVYTTYTSLAVFWLAIIGLIVVIKMKLNEIERIQKLGIDREDSNAPMLE